MFLATASGLTIDSVCSIAIKTPPRSTKRLLAGPNAVAHQGQKVAFSRTFSAALYAVGLQYLNDFANSSGGIIHVILGGKATYRKSQGARGQLFVHPDRP